MYMNSGAVSENTLPSCILTMICDKNSFFSHLTKTSRVFAVISAYLQGKVFSRLQR